MNRIIRLETVDSTNTYAKNLIRQGAAQGTAVVADRQTAGRGRLGRSFASPAGLGIYCSVILRPDAQAEQLLPLTPVMAEAARRAIVRTTGLKPQIKWINDLVLGGKKLCGILTEPVFTGKALEAVVVGVGINCNHQKLDFPEELQEIATSLSMESGKIIDREAVLKALLEEIALAADGFLTELPRWLEPYRRHCLTLGRDVQLLRNGEVRYAHVDGMDDQGALLVTLTDGTKETIFSGEASVRGMYGYI